ncbi:hypothetical protein LBMAG53_27110 [Planctomycetota bacterium]|nr:hypothetical protein LBMAG53_27110 [Planctomycetota bacterium]
MSRRGPLQGAPPEPRPAGKPIGGDSASAGEQAPGPKASEWFSETGLRFTCTRCGACCTGAAGFTWISEPELAVLADHLGLDPDTCRRRYTRSVHFPDGRVVLSLNERGNGDCVFFRAGTGCTVYDQRPRQCRTWPFWKRVVATSDSWSQSAAGCPGMNQGRLVAADEVRGIASDDGLPG